MWLLVFVWELFCHVLWNAYALHFLVYRNNLMHCAFIAIRLLVFVSCPLIHISHVWCFFLYAYYIRLLYLYAYYISAFNNFLHCEWWNIHDRTPLCAVCISLHLFYMINKWSCLYVVFAPTRFISFLNRIIKLFFFDHDKNIRTGDYNILTSCK